MDTSQTPQLNHQKTVAFKIWYSDKVVQSTDLAGATLYQKWLNAPHDDVQLVMVYFAQKDGMGRHTRLFSSGCDYYALNEQGQLTSHFDNISKVQGHVLYGKFMDYEAHLKLCKVAYDDYGEGWLYPATPKSNTTPPENGRA